MLADAGYPNGFEVGMDCPNDRYVNDEAICQAVVAMLARIGVKVNLKAQTRNLYFAKILRKTTVAGRHQLLHAGLVAGPDLRRAQRLRGPDPDARTGDQEGPVQRRRLLEPGVDKLADAMEQETDKAKRDDMIAEAYQLYVDDFAYIPLHQQALVWATRKNIDLFQRADNSFQLRFVK